MIGRLACTFGVHATHTLAEGGHYVEVCSRCEPVRFATLRACQPTFASMALEMLANWDTSYRAAELERVS